MKLPPTLTLDEAVGALQALSAQGPEAGAWIVDASELQVFDSSALAVLLQAKRRAQTDGHAFEVRAVSPKLLQLAQLYGVAELLGLAGAGVTAQPGRA